MELLKPFSIASQTTDLVLYDIMLPTDLMTLSPMKVLKVNQMQLE